MIANGDEDGFTRRQLIGRALPWTALAGLQGLPQVAFGRTPPGSSRDVLVLVFLRGGMDGLTTCVPYGDPDLYLARPSIAVPPPGGSDGAIDLDGFFGLSPAAAPLLAPYQAGHLAFVHATGSTDATRSHFEAYQFMEFGIPGQPGGSVANGWLARHLLGIDPLVNGAPLRGLAITSVMPLTLSGAPATLAILDPDGFAFVGGSTPAQRRALLARSYAATAEPLRSTGRDTFGTFDLLDTIDFAGYVPAHGAAYPGTSFGGALKNASALIKAAVGVECLMLEMSGWDLHASLAGNMRKLLDDLSLSLLAFYQDHLDDLSQLTVLVMSEFGRRVAENGSHGADHGHGNCMMVMGGHVAGGQVLADWPGLSPQNLDSGDLRITIDYRDIIAEILVKRMAEEKIGDVFPNYTPSFRGIIV
ncbi:MAG: DUF1501 domain-containing protein [Planctomycetota bacterium]